MITITNNVFELPIIPDITYSLEFKTDFTPSISGSESRVIRWGEPRLRLSFPEMPLLRDEIDYIKSFFNAREGKKDGFLLKVPDFSSLGINKGRLLLLDETENLYQIVCIYSVDDVKTIKPIRFPITGTTKVFLDEDELTDGWTVNSSTGQIQFESEPVGELTVSCEYYTPFRFDTDEIEALQVSGGNDDLFRYVENPSSALLLLRERVGSLEPIYQVNGLVLKEVHRPLSRSFYDVDDFNPIANDFIYPIIPENVRSNRFSTEITSGVSDVEDAVTRSNRMVTRYASTGLSNNQLDYIVNYFLTAKGRAISFNGRRFDSDKLSYTRISPDDVNMSDVTTISAPDSNNRRYQVFGQYLSKYTGENRFGFLWQDHPSCSTQNRYLVRARTRIKNINSTQWFGTRTTEQVVFGPVGTPVFWGIDDGDNPYGVTYKGYTVTVAGTTSLIGGAEMSNGSISLGESFSTFLGETWIGELLSFEVIDVSVTSTHYWRTVAPVILSPNETPADIVVRRNLIDGLSWVVGKRSNTNPFNDINLIDIENDLYLHKVLEPEVYMNGNTLILYRSKNDLCNGAEESPSFPRGDDFFITDIVEVSNTVVGRCLPYATILTIERDDDEIYRYTSWDSDLIINGDTYKSNAGIVPSAVASKSDMSVDNSEVSTYFDEITEVDILSNKFNNAKVKAEIVNISDVTLPLIDLFGGEIGKITATDTGFTFELRSKSHHLNQPISVKTTDTCQHKFCDSKCTLNIEDFTTTGFTVTEIVPSQFATRSLKLTPAPSSPSARNGYIQFTSGQLEGQKFDIKDTTSIGDAGVKLWQSLPFGMSVGDELNIVRGCEKTPDACKDYDNFANFGGFLTGGNWMIGDDALLSGQ